MDDISTKPGSATSESSNPAGVETTLPRNGENGQTGVSTPARSITAKRIVIPASARKVAKRDVAPAPVETPTDPSAAYQAPAEPLVPDTTPVSTIEPLPVLDEPVSLNQGDTSGSTDTLAATSPGTPLESPAPVASTDSASATSEQPSLATDALAAGAIAGAAAASAQPVTPNKAEQIVPTTRIVKSSKEGIKPTQTPYRLNESTLAPVPQTHRGRGLGIILWALAAVLLIVAIISIIPFFFPNLLPNIGGIAAVQPTATVTAVVLAQNTIQPSATATIPPTQSAETPGAPVQTTAPIVIPTPPADGLQMSLLPVGSVTGWFGSNEQTAHFGDENLQTGTLQGNNLASLIQFDLRNQPIDSKILFGALELTGLNASHLGTTGTWHVDLLDNSLGTDWSGSTPEQLAVAPSLGTIGTFAATDLQAGKLNRIILDDASLQLLAKQFKNGRAVIRLSGPEGTTDNLFTWESGANGAALTAPTLHLVVEPGKYVIVTNTPQPKNVLTAAAYVVRGTAAANRNGTPTSFPPGVATATPGGEIVEIDSETAIPGNDATAIAMAQLATAIARTTGTYTPTPKSVVIVYPTFTPVIIDPNTLSTATPIPPDVDLANIPFDYAKCQCKGLIMILTNRYGDKDLAPILVQPDGTDVGKLSGDFYYKLAAAREIYSPDHTRRIIYPIDSKGVQQIGFEDVGSGAITFLTNFPKGLAYDASWSPDGNSIAFVSTERGNTDEIYIYDFGTQKSTRITDATGLGQPWSKHPSWSPDGSQIAFWSSRSGHNQVWVMNRDGTGLINISQNDFDEQDPVWVK